jgi:sensor histidine kinase regulating citrate/malate metabolism
VVTRGHEEAERVVGHMVQNAFDATEHHGRVWLKLDRLWGQAMPARSVTPGMGMSEEFVPRRLVQAVPDHEAVAGMGIGAYESLQYVQELGGKITVDSKEGEGTIVTLLLPVFECSGNRIYNLSERCMSTDKSNALLIVEDDLALQKQIKWSLDRSSR